MDLLNGCRLLTCFLIRDKRSLLGLQVTGLQVYIIDLTAVSPSIRNPHCAVRTAKSGIHFSLHFTSLHFTSLHFTSLHFTSLHFTSLHFISLHFTSLHFTSFHFTSLHFTSLNIKATRSPQSSKVDTETLFYPSPHLSKMYD